MQSSELQPDGFSLNICSIPFEQKQFDFDEIEKKEEPLNQQQPIKEEPLKEEPIIKRTDNNSSSYTQRQSNINAGEEVFEAYMKEKNYEFQRFGFDEKNNNIKGFFLMHPFLRSLPDYISYFESRKKLYYIQVKGTNKLKLDDILNYSHFESMFCNQDSELVIFFCFKNEKPIIKTLTEIKRMITGCEIKEWHDKKQYFELNLNK
jgi:hypothetical protein